VTNVVVNGMEVKAALLGFGRHTQFLPVAQIAECLKLAQIGLLLAHVASWAVKMSICFFLLALVRGTHRSFRSFIWVLMTLTTITTVVSMFLWGFQGRPISRLWDPRVHGFGSSAATKGYVAMIYIRSCKPRPFLSRGLISAHRKRPVG
jgi:hypothetical protein